MEIEIADGGMTYIRVTDNGSGMTAEDAKMSIIRHATSKISNVDNIYHIASLGFRGEALSKHYVRFKIIHHDKKTGRC